VWHEDSAKDGTGLEEPGDLRLFFCFEGRWDGKRETERLKEKKRGFGGRK